MLANILNLMAYPSTYLMGFKALILLFIAVPYIYNAYKIKTVPEIFIGTIGNYFKTALLTSLCAALMAYKFCYQGYLTGLTVALFIVAILLLITFDYSYTILNYKNEDNNIETTKSFITNNVAEASTIVGIFYLTLLSLMISLLGNKGSSNSLTTAAIVLCSIKIIGHIYTKLGDIVNDYQQKVLKKADEDKNTTEFGLIDNIGDLFGDAYGNIVEYMIYGIIAFKLFVVNLLFTSSIIHVGLDKGYIVLIAMFLVSKIKNKNYSGNLLLVGFILIFDIVEPLLKHLLYYQYNIADVSKYMLYHIKSHLFIVLPIITLLLSGQMIIKKLAREIHSSAIKIPVTGLINNFIASALISTSMTFLALGSVKIGLYFNAISYPIVFDLFVSIGAIMIYRTFYGAFVDCSCGIIKKYVYQQEATSIVSSDELNKLRHNADIAYNYLEELDSEGNLYKLEAKIILNYLSQVSIILYTHYLDHFVFIADITIVGIVCLILGLFSFTLRESISGINNNLTFKLPFYAFNIIALSYVSANLIFNMDKQYATTLMLLILCISMFSNISGALFDCVKKIAEEKGQTKEPYYQDLIQQDMLGDILKDVLGPILYAVFIIYLLNV